MASLLGKRKRRENTDKDISGENMSDSNSSTSEKMDIHDSFRSHFESKFQPLVAEREDLERPVADTASESESEENEWEGFESEGEEVLGDILVVEDQVGYVPTASPNADRKAFMTSKPPSLERKSPNQSGAAAEAEDDKVERLNLKNDVELQRLINESHLLDKSRKANASVPRLRTLDARLQALGSKTSILGQEKMPAAHRRGIVAKATEREERRREEARENGVILERPDRTKRVAERRVRQVGGPGIGKFRGGTLRLSKRDVGNITGQRSRPDAAGRHRR